MTSNLKQNLQIGAYLRVRLIEQGKVTSEQMLDAMLDTYLAHVLAQDGAKDLRLVGQAQTALKKVFERSKDKFRIKPAEVRALKECAGYLDDLIEACPNMALVGACVIADETLKRAIHASR